MKYTKFHNGTKPRQQLNSDVIFPHGLILFAVITVTFFEVQSIGHCLRQFSGADRCTMTAFLRGNIFDKYKNTLHILFPQPVRQMVYLNQVIIYGRGGRTQGRKWMRFLSENTNLCIPESVLPGKIIFLSH